MEHSSVIRVTTAPTNNLPSQLKNIIPHKISTLEETAGSIKTVATAFIR